MTAPHRRPVTASVAPDASATETGPTGQRAHRSHLAHSERFRRRVEKVTDGVWSVIGNGISNQNIVEGPDGLIVFDTGECVEDMAWALDQLRAHTAAPVSAIVYTHSHYVGGAAAIDGAGDRVPIWGHADIEATRNAIGLEFGPAVVLGAIHQFALFNPREGDDGLVNVGLGNEFSRSDHPSHTPGFLAPTHAFREPTTTTLAGLRVELTPAPSDAEDSITIWLPDVGVCVHNIVWPALFNVYAIRGEAYRDPRILLRGIDHVIGLGAEHLLGTHGPPLSGADEVRSQAIRSRDAIQFLWDQTVRGINKGLTQSELTSFVQLPPVFDDSYLTQQLYGLAEHHVRQIHTGLRGWFDNDETHLLPLPEADRAARLIGAMGGADAVRARAGQALDDDDVRWALELAALLVRRHGDTEAPEPERSLLAEVLRTIAQRTTSANLRNWCLTRALEHEGQIDLDRFRVHRFSRQAVLDAPPDAGVHALRVVLDPEAADGVDDEVAVRFADAPTAGLHVRHHVAVPTDGIDAMLVLSTDHETWADVLSGATTLRSAVDAGSVTLTGDGGRIARVLRCFDVPSLQLS